MACSVGSAGSCEIEGENKRGQLRGGAPKGIRIELGLNLPIEDDAHGEHQRRDDAGGLRIRESGDDHLGKCAGIHKDLDAEKQDKALPLGRLDALENRPSLAGATLLNTFRDVFLSTTRSRTRTYPKTE